MTPPPVGGRFGLVGHPVAHSLSPRLFALMAAPGTYTLHDVPPEALAAWLETTARTLDGFNVTVPHKATVASRCASLTPEARRLGAVNCVRVEPDGAFSGANTDVIGFELALGPAPVSRAVVLGAGGAARAVVEVLLGHGVASIELVNRSRARAEALVAARGPAERARIRASGPAALEAAFDRAELVVQCTSAALHDPAAFSELPWARTSPDARALELVYRPRQTAFLQGAALHGRRTEDGLTMLAGQAIAALAFFTRTEGAPEVRTGLAHRCRALADRLRASVD